MNKIILTGSPLSTGQIYRHTSRGGYVRTYMSNEGKALKQDYQLQAKSQYRGAVITSPVSVQVELFFKDKRKRDVDNFNKILFDALTGIVWKDDDQIYELYIVKNIDRDNPRVELYITEIDI